MKQQFLANFPYVSMAITGQLLFMTVFVSSVFWIFRKGSKDFYARLATLPLDNGASAMLQSSASVPLDKKGHHE